MQPRYAPGAMVRIVHRALGEQQAKIISRHSAGRYTIEFEGHTLTVHERFISEF